MEGKGDQSVTILQRRGRGCYALGQSFKWRFPHAPPQRAQSLPVIPSPISQRSINKTLLTGEGWGHFGFAHFPLCLGLGRVHSILVKKKPQSAPGVIWGTWTAMNKHRQLCTGVSSCVCSHSWVCTALSRYVQVCTGVSAVMSRCAQPYPGVPGSSRVCLQPHPSVHSYSQLCPGVSRCPHAHSCSQV